MSSLFAKEFTCFPELLVYAQRRTELENAMRTAVSTELGPKTAATLELLQDGRYRFKHNGDPLFARTLTQLVERVARLKAGERPTEPKQEELFPLK